MTMVHLTTCMTFLQPGTHHVMKEGIIPLFDDLLADEVRRAMPLCNEYGVVGTNAIIPPPAPREGRRRLEREASFGDISPEDPWSSDDEEDVEIPLSTAGAAGAAPPVATAGKPPVSGPASPRATISLPMSPGSEQESGCVPPPLADPEEETGSPSWSGVFGGLEEQRWFFSGQKRPQR